MSKQITSTRAIPLHWGFILFNSRFRELFGPERELIRTYILPVQDPQEAAIVAANVKAKRGRKIRLINHKPRLNKDDIVYFLVDPDEERHWYQRATARH